MLISRKIVLLIKQYQTLIKLDFIKFIFNELCNNFSLNISLKNSKRKGQLLFDNFEIIENFGYRYVILKNIAHEFNLKLKYFNLGKNLLYFLIYYSCGASNINFILFKIKNKFLIKNLYLKEIIKIKSKKALFNYKFKNINIGWDIYESYLRRFNQPTLDIHDKNFKKLFYQALQIYCFWEDYLKNNNVKYIMTSHRMYIETNILNKLAIKKNIPILTTDGSGIMKFSSNKLSIHKYYKELFNKIDLKEKNKALKLAKSRLDLRLSGSVGIDMSYSTKSAFSKKTKPSNKYNFSKNKTNILICTHDFYDNPHGFGKNFFIDFYEWLIFLSKISFKTNYDWYVKPHPDYSPGTLEIIKKINKKFKNIKLLNSNTKFNEISHGIDFALTAHGTIGHELPLLGVTVINSNPHNPHCAYKFNYTPKNITDYKNKILNLNKKVKIKINKKEIYQFYYMHYYYMKSNLFNSLRKIEPKSKGISFLKSAQQMYFNSKFENDNLKIKNFLLSKSSKYFDDKKKEIIFSKICNL